jgi:hypothetical protein
MNIVAIIGAVLQIFLLWIKAKGEKDAEKKQKMDEIVKEASDALKARDTSALSSSFDKLNRL